MNKIIDNMLEIKKLGDLYIVLKQIEEANKKAINPDVSTIIQIYEILSKLQNDYLSSEKGLIDELIAQLKCAIKTFEAQAEGTADILCDFFPHGVQSLPLDSKGEPMDRKGYDPRILQAQLMRRVFRKLNMLPLNLFRERAKKKKGRRGKRKSKQAISSSLRKIANV